MEPQTRCPNCREPFTINLLPIKKNKTPKNARRSVMFCSKCGLTAREAVLKWLQKQRS